MKCVPVAETVECMASDGTTEKTVRSLDMGLLSLDREPTTLETVASDVQALKAASVQQPVRRSGFWNRAEKRYSVTGVEEDVEVKVKEGGWVEGTLTIVAWVVFGVVLALFTYALFN